MSKEHPLDNVAWNSLTTSHKHLGKIGKKAAMYHPQISMIAGVSEYTQEAFTELAKMAQPGIPVLILSDNPLPDHTDWDIRIKTEVNQMTCDSPIEYEEIQYEILTPDDVPQMLELVKLTEPGPFGPRTIEMGTYIGLKVDGKLVAMGGERLKPDGYVALSGICTHPDYRGKGYASAITGALTNKVLERGKKPFLYVALKNTGAFRLYEKLGYSVRRTVRVTGIMKKQS